MDDELLHAETMRNDLQLIKAVNLERVALEVERLIDLAVQIITVRYDERDDAISELEEFLR